ncbi:glyoxalase/Bleomycin resistance /Dioxygenase superfamily protein, partial [Vibrio cholerae HC-37A1]
TSSICR